MKQDWKFGVLDDAVDRGSSNISLNKIKDDDGEFPVFGAKGFIQNASFYQQENQYLAIIKDGAGIGRVSTHPEKSSVLATMQYILPKQSYDIKFLYYFLNSIDFNKYRTGSTIPHIYYKNYKLEPFPLVSKEEQKQIVAKLDQCFEAIDKAKANAAKNLENAKELFQSKLNDIFSQKGEGWVEKKLGQIGTLTSSKRIYKKEYVSEGVPFYRSKEIKELAHNNDISLELYITEDRYEEIKSRFGIPEEGDILLTAVGTIGEMYVVKSNERFYFKDGNIMWLKDFSSLNSYYLKYALTFFVEQLKAMSQGSAYSALTIEKLKEYSIPVPSISKQEWIIKQLDTLKEQTQSLESKYQQELNSLEELKKSILQKAFEGEL